MISNNDSSVHYDNLSISNYFITPYEKVLKILHKLKIKYLNINDLQAEEDLEYVIETIQNKSLYSYTLDNIEQNLIKSQSNDNFGFNNIRENTEIKVIMDSLKEYSEPIRVKEDNHNKTENLFTRYAKEKFKTTKPQKSNCDFFKSLGKKIDHISINLDMSILNNENIVKEVQDKNFDIFNFYNKHKNDSFSIIGKVIYNTLGLFDTIYSKCLSNFLSSVQKGYCKEPAYHNEIHGIDVCHTIFSFIYFSTDFTKKFKFSNIDILALITAGICHDIGHPGFNNNFHLNTLSSYAVSSNDKSVLESYHAKQATKILLKDENNIVQCLDKQDFLRFRKLFIQGILATDMTQHSKTNTVIKYKLEKTESSSLNDFIPSYDNNIDEIQEMINFLLHTADLSHNSKSFSISKIWTKRLTDEFWNQGDQEVALNLPPSFLCDRITNKDIPQSQIGFIKGIVAPSIDLLVKLIPEMRFLMENIENNLKEWEKLKTSSNDFENSSERNTKNIPFSIYFD